MSENTQIHCDLREIYGPEWTSLSDDQIKCIANRIHKSEELFGGEPQLFGFVGTRKIGDDIVGGYFAIQYSDEEFHYTKNKKLNKKHNNPFERVFFILLSRSGKVLLQNTKFVGIPLNMHIALRLFQEALNRILESCNVKQIYSLVLEPEKTKEADFLHEFERSTRVVELDISYPTADNIPEEFVYYNPQTERNEIIRDSHRHDYPHLKKIDLEALEGGDLKQTHLRDLIHAGEPQKMHYYIGIDEFTLRKDVKQKFEIRVDMEAEQISEENLLSVIKILRRERAVYLDNPTPKYKDADSNDGQVSFLSELD